MREDFTFFAFMLIGPFTAVAVLVGVITAVDYAISSQSTVNAINAQCGTHYKRIDYLRVGTDTMQKLCQIKEQTINLREDRP